MSPGTPLTLCPVRGWHRQQHHCQGEWGAPSQRGQLACWLQPGKVDQTWVHPSSCSGWRSLREGRLAEASVQQIQHTSSSRPHTLGKPCMKPETPLNASRTEKQGCVPEVSSFLSICSGLPSLDATKCPSQDWCASPPLPDHCHWHECKASRLRAIRAPRGLLSLPTARKPFILGLQHSLHNPFPCQADTSQPCIPRSRANNHSVPGGGALP